MKLSLIFLASLGCSACASSPAASNGCPYLPEFRTLQQQLPQLQPADAAAALEKYTRTHENPENCEATEIDLLLNDAEKPLFVLSAGREQIPAQIVFRCDQFDATTARCESPMLDTTANPSSAGIAPGKRPPASPWRIESRKNGATLVALYAVSLGGALDGKPATEISREAAFTLPDTMKDIALVAIYKTSGAWKYRKAVWYF